MSAVEAEALQFSADRRLRRMLSAIATPVLVRDAEGRLLFSSDSVVELYGWTPQELEGLDWRHPERHPADLARMAEGWQWILDHPGEIHVIAVRTKRRDGEWRWIEAVSRNLLDDPAVGGIVGTLQDVTDRVQREQVARIFAETAVAPESGDTLRGMLRRMIAATARETGFDYAEAWVPEPDGCLRMVEWWQAPGTGADDCPRGRRPPLPARRVDRRGRRHAGRDGGRPGH